MNFNLPFTNKFPVWLVAGLGVVGMAVAVAALASTIFAQDAPRTSATDDRKQWQAVAPGRVEPRSGEIKIMAPIVGNIGEILVKPNDKVFDGELLIRLHDNEMRARLATAVAQVAMRKRARNDQSASARAADRRRAEDAVADAEKAVIDTRADLDAAAIARRAGNGSDGKVDNARTAYQRARERLEQDQAALRKLEADSGVPLPNALEGQLNVARAEWLAAEAAIEKMMIRAPLAGTVLQINARAGELAGPAATQPLLVLGDISALRVRAEVDERDFGEIKIGQPALVRTAAFRGRDIAGKVSAVAPIVDAGRINLRGQRSLTDINVVEVVIDLAEPGPLAVGMKVEVYFQTEGSARQ